MKSHSSESMTHTLDEQIAFVEHAMLRDVRDNAEFVAILASLRQLRDSQSGAEPVTWRWRSKGLTTWIYDPKIEWLNQQSTDAIHKEPLFARPPGLSVPEEPTEEMIEALYGKYLSPTCHKSRIEGYKAMLAAAKK